MQFKNPMLIVKNIDLSVEFYNRVLGLEVIQDFGANKTLTGGISMQTKETYEDFISRDISFGSNNFELYFEEDDFDSFMERLEDLDVQYVHPLIEHRWGQRVIRFYDPDFHIIEVGENIKTVCLRFINSGMTKEEVSQRMDVHIEFVESCLK